MVLLCFYWFKILLDILILLLEVLEFGFLFIYCREWIFVIILKCFLFWMLWMNVKCKCNICKVDILVYWRSFLYFFLMNWFLWYWMNVNKIKISLKNVYVVCFKINDINKINVYIGKKGLFGVIVYLYLLWNFLWLGLGYFLYF